MAHLLMQKPCYLPNEIINIINNYNYGPSDLIVSKYKKELNKELLKSKIWLNIIDSYEKIPELYFLDDKENLIDDTYKMWYDYEFAKRIPKLIH